MRLTVWMMCIILTGVVCCWGIAFGDDQNGSPAEVIKSRIANFHKIRDALKGIRDQVRKSDPALPEIQQFAGRIQSLGSQIPTWFPPGTDAAAQAKDRIGTSHRVSSGSSGKEDGKTRAKNEIWTRRSAFEDAHKRFLAEAQKMNEIARSGDKAALLAQYEVLGQACKNCHNTFRE